MYDSALCQFLRDYTILYIEDDELTLEYLAKMLEVYFKNVITSRNGLEAYATILKNNVDIILTDINMPHENGLVFVEKFRKINSNAPVVFLSAYSQTDILINAIPLGASAFLVKPVSIEVIVNTLADALRSKNNIQKSNKYQLTNRIEANLEEKSLSVDSVAVYLSKKEFDLLEIFIRNKKSILTKYQIEYLLWNGDVISDSSVKTLIKKLRSKIGEETILTIKNLGYTISHLKF